MLFDLLHDLEETRQKLAATERELAELRAARHATAGEATKAMNATELQRILDACQGIDTTSEFRALLERVTGVVWVHTTDGSDGFLLATLRTAAGPTAAAIGIPNGDGPLALAFTTEDENPTVTQPVTAGTGANVVQALADAGVRLFPLFEHCGTEGCTNCDLHRDLAGADPDAIQGVVTRINLLEGQVAQAQMERDQARMSG